MNEAASNPANHLRRSETNFSNRVLLLLFSIIISSVIEPFPAIFTVGEIINENEPCCNRKQDFGPGRFDMAESDIKEWRLL